MGGIEGQFFSLETPDLPAVLVDQANMGFFGADLDS